MRASWAAAVTEGLNSLGVMGPAHTLVRDGAGGFGFAPLPANNRFRSGVSALPPFAVRHVEATDANAEVTERIPYTGWEIYLPSGCVTVGASCRPLNPRAYRTVDGETRYIEGWYVMRAPDGDGSDGDVWKVVVHAKCCAAVAGVDEIASWPRPYVFAEMHDAARSDEDAGDDTSDIGDSLSVTVGKVTWSAEEDADARAIHVHTVRTPVVTRGDDAQGAFAPLWVFDAIDDVDDIALGVAARHVRNLTFSAAGATFSSYQWFEIDEGMTDVYLKIRTDTDPYVGEAKAYAIQTRDSAELTVAQQVQEDQGPTDVMVLVFRFDAKGRMTLDNRVALQNIQVYR